MRPDDAYHCVPLLCYSAGLVSACLLLTGSKESEAGLYVLAGAALLLLITNIRNAWDLMLSLARRNAQRVNPPND